MNDKDNFKHPGRISLSLSGAELEILFKFAEQYRISIHEAARTLLIDGLVRYNEEPA